MFQKLNISRDELRRDVEGLISVFEAVSRWLPVGRANVVVGLLQRAVESDADWNAFCDLLGIK